MVKNKVVFSTGCKSAKCIADLSVKSSLVGITSLPYILGSTSSISIDYNIQNSAETAYLAQIRVTLPDSNIAFTKTPSNCKVDDDAPNFNIMVCDVNNGSPMFNGDKAALRISIDTTKLDGDAVTIKAQVFSTGDELNEADNIVDNVIPLGEFSDVEILGDSSKDTLTLADGLHLENLTHTFEIRNNGPSNIKSLNVFVSIPVSFVNPWTLERENLINFSSISIKGKHNNQPLEVEWTQNNTILIANAIESTSLTSNIAVDNFNGMQFDASKIGLEYDLNSGDPSSGSGYESIGDNTDSLGVGRRRRRSMNRYYSSYLQRIVDSQDEIGASRHRRDIFNANDRLLANLPFNRTIYFDCQNAEQELCLQAKFTVLNFNAGNTPILISLNFTIDLKKVGK